VTTRNDACAALQKCLCAAEVAAARLQAARAEEELSRRAYEESVRAASPASQQAIERAEEPAWAADTEQLVMLIQEGPRRPTADARDRAEKQPGEWEAQYRPRLGPRPARPYAGYRWSPMTQRRRLRALESRRDWASDPSPELLLDAPSVDGFPCKRDGAGDRS
jgi:hypothetical protein